MTQEQELKELSRDQFMEMTGIFISHIYFDDMIHDDYLESGLNQKDFCKQWLQENDRKIETLNSNDSFRYVIDDVEISCLEDEDIEVDDLTKDNIIESLSKNEKYWRDTASKQITEYKDIAKELSKCCKEIKEAYYSHKKNSEKIESLFRWRLFISEFEKHNLINAYNILLKQIDNTEGEFNDELENGNSDYNISIKF